MHVHMVNVGGQEFMMIVVYTNKNVRETKKATWEALEKKTINDLS